jgi:cation diffusion facilitator CzcD-associated flavoprotein CzcO
MEGMETRGLQAVRKGAKLFQREILQTSMLDIAIVGAGPYGLSIAAHLRKSGVSFRIFGRAMDSWREHMAKGMMLKSDGFASNLYDPEGACTLEDFCAQRGIAYHHTEIPVALDTFSSYGLAFREQLVPHLEEKNVVSITRLPEGFLLRFDSGEEARARRVVLAVGITHFKYVPEIFANLPPEYSSHTYQHHDLAPFRGRNVVVVGGGASAIELAGLLREAGAEAQLVARRKELVFHTAPVIGHKRSLWQRIRNPKSGLGPGVKSRFFANWASVFRHLPESTRLRLVRTTLGPSAGWTSKKQVVGRVPLLLGMTPERAQVLDGKVRLTLRAADGTLREVLTDHVITGTGYKVDIERLQFLSAEIRRDIAVVGSAPVLSADFESSVAGLYFVGLAAANTFGPVMRFAFGAGFAARRVSKALLRSASPGAVRDPGAQAVAPARAEGTTTR